MFVGFGVGFLVLLGALGSGPTFALARNLPARLVLSPMVGFALAAGVLSTAAWIMPMKTAAWVLLLPGTVASAILAIGVGRQKPQHDLREASAPISLVIVGLVLAFIPGFLRETVGPTSLTIGDAGYYINVGIWLRDYTLSDAPPAGAAWYDLVLFYGYNATLSNIRIGPSAVNSAVSVIFGATPDETHQALLGTLYALLPATIWFAARMLGVGRLPAAVGAFFGLSPALLHLVGDSALANLGGLLLAPVVLILGIRSILHGTVGEVFLAAILGGGLAAVFPEYLPPLFLIGMVGTVTFVLYRIVKRGLQLPWLLALGRRMALLAVGVLLVSFDGIVRAAMYLATIRSNSLDLEGLPDRSLTIETVGAWAFGLLHLYELPQFDLLSGPQTILAIGLPVLLSLLIFWGALKKGAEGVLFVLGPVGTSLSLGLYSYSRFQDGHCGYCAWKSFTFMLPFLGLGIALGLQWLTPRLLRREGFARAVAVGAAFVVFLSAVAVVRADAKLTIAQYQSPAIVPTDLRRIADKVHELPKPATILLEGEDASAAPSFITPAFYYLMRGEDTKTSFETTPVAATYLGGALLKDELGASLLKDELGAYYTPDYSYVVTAFPGLQSDRTLIARRGPYAVFRRAPIDVAIVRTGWAWDSSEGRRAIPWVTNPFELWISSEQSGTAALSLRLTRARNNDSTLSFSLDGKKIVANRSVDDSRLCVEVPLKEGRTVLDVTPQVDPKAVTKSANLPGQWLIKGTPVPPPPKELGLRSVEVQPERCPAELD